MCSQPSKDNYDYMDYLQWNTIEFLLGNIKEDNEVLELYLSWTKSVSGLACIEKDSHGGKKPTIKNASHMHDQLGMTPEEQRELFSDLRRHLSTIAREPEKVTSNI